METREGAGVLAGLRSWDGPLSVRVRPSSLKRDCNRRTTSAGGKCLVNVHAKSLDTGDLYEHSGQKTRARPEPAWTGRGPSPSGCGAVTRAVPGARDSCSHEALDDGTNRRSRRCLTATVTATAPANDKRQRSAAPKDGRMSCSNWDRSGLKSGSSTVPPCVTSSMLKGRSPQFRNLICARICAQDAAGQAETGETRTT